MTVHHRKSFGTFCLSFLIWFSTAQAFETWSLPIEHDLKTLRISNLTSQPQDFWMTNSSLDSPPQEQSYQVPAFGIQEIPLSEINFPWIRLLTEKNKSLQFQVETSTETRAFLNSGASTQWKVRSRSSSELVIFNMAPFSQKVVISADGEWVENLNLKAYEKIKWPVSSGSLLTISGEARLGGFLLSPSGARAWIPDPVPVILKPSSEPVYFRLSNESQSQSFVVALSDPKLIEEARKQIQNPNIFMSRILIAKVSAGHGDHNRDFTSANKSPWSWHVSQVYRFAQMASQDCDGSPELLEENLGSWIQNGSPICFWNYRILEEISPSRIAKP